MTEPSTFEDYPFITRLLERGYDVSLGGRTEKRAWVTVCDEGGGLIMFEKGEMNSRQVMEKLERHAQELLEDGMKNDEINGVRERIWSD
jgi:hypothetical protein